MSHLRYLRYVLLHKWYVLRAGLLIARITRQYRARLLWRLLVHDWSKFLPDEWRAYAAYFYGQLPLGAKKEALAAFNLAWLKHLHRNDHHWQHWLLQQDSGTKLQLLPPAYVADEMLADWLGAGTKILHRPTLAQCVTETIVWYMQNRAVIQLRTRARERIEETLWALADYYGMHAAAAAIHRAKESRVTVMVPVPPPNHGRA